MLIFGTILMTVCHLIFAFAPPGLSEYADRLRHNHHPGYLSFSLVPTALWPSVPKIAGPLSGFGLFADFSGLNIGLCLFRQLSAMRSNSKAIQPSNGTAYNYTLPMVIFCQLRRRHAFLGIMTKAKGPQNSTGLTAIISKVAKLHNK